MTVSAARGLANINASENAIGKRLAMGNTANRMQGGTRGQTTSARLVVEILEAAASGDLAAELSMDYELTVNLKTAKDLGVTIPPTLLVAATKVIE